MDKKGFMIELLAVMIVGFIAVLFFGGIIYGISTLNGLMTDSSLDTEAVNITRISKLTISQLSIGVSSLRLLSAVMIIWFILATFITAYFSSKHPAWIVVYIMILILFVIFSVSISNSYEIVRNKIPDIISGFTMADWLILNLPIAVVVIGLIGILISVAGNLAARKVFE